MTSPQFDFDSYDETILIEDSEPVVETRHDRMVRLGVERQRMGVSERVAFELLASYPLDAIEQQIEWLPHRRAKRRSSLIVAAIKGDYEKPAVLLEAEFGDPNGTA